MKDFYISIHSIFITLFSHSWKLLVSKKLPLSLLPYLIHIQKLWQVFFIQRDFSNGIKGDFAHVV